MRANRRSVLAMGAGIVASRAVAAPAPSAPPLDRRPPPSERLFRSEAVERAIMRVSDRAGTSPAGRRLAATFAQCFPNTLDTTVHRSTRDGKPDTFVVTGDIDAMWLRDSSAQVWPYLPLAREDPALREMIAGVIHRQARCVLIDPYANAFAHDERRVRALDDGTEMRPGVFERKFEVDSLAYVLRLSHGYWRANGDTAPFDAEWRAAVASILATFRTMQRRDGPGPYRFQRMTRRPSDTAAYDGRGMPMRATGMIASVFRPSDDGTVFPFLVPSNMMAATALRDLADLARAIDCPDVGREAVALAGEIDAGVRAHAIVDQPRFGRVFAFEVDGYGGRLIGDDANAPSLLSLPYFGACRADDPVYRATRALVLSDANPWYFSGREAAGIGSAHTGYRRVWLIALIMRALTTADADETLTALRQLLATTAGTGFMHEAFDVDDSRKFSRPWFAWANTLFGELVLAVLRDRPAVLDRLNQGE